MTFASDKTLEQLKLDTTRKFRVVEEYCEDLKVGDILTFVDYDKGDFYAEFRNTRGETEYINFDWLEYVERSKSDKYEVGDILVDSDGDYRRVLGYCGGEGGFATYIVSNYSRDKNSTSLKQVGCSRTRFDFDAMSLSLDIQEEEITELTLEEVAKLAGRDVKNIRIKE